MSTGRDPTPLATLNRFLEARNEGEVNDLVENLLDDVDWDDYNPPLYRQEYGRIIRLKFTLACVKYVRLNFFHISF